MCNIVLFISALIVVLLILLVYRWKSSVSNPAHSVVLFYRDGCVFCEMFKPEWAKVEHRLKDRAKKYNTADPKNAQLAAQYKVSGVPTIVMLDRNGGYETYLGSRDVDQIMARLM